MKPTGGRFFSVKSVGRRGSDGKPWFTKKIILTGSKPDRAGVSGKKPLKSEYLP